jgi:hypothetical protein
MIELLIALIFAILGFVTGALVYRNNLKRVEGALIDAKQIASDISNSSDSIIRNLQQEISELRRRIATTQKK